MTESTITVETEYEPVADYHYIRTKVITDKKPMRKYGVSGYYIKAYQWYGKWEYCAFIDCNWFMNTCPSFSSLREASDWIRKYMYS